jgi:hypothetical protein
MRPMILSRRDWALLRAVADGRCDLIITAVVPDLRVDGRWFCDQPRAHALLTAGLVARASTEPGNAPMPALLTATGRAALEQSLHAGTATGDTVGRASVMTRSRRSGTPMAA